MADSHGAAYNHSPEVNKQSGNLPWQESDNYGGYGGMPACGTESRPDGDNDTDDIGTYSPIPRPVENDSYGTGSNGFITDRQRGYSDGGWN
jgi:hypothetical protein